MATQYYKKNVNNRTERTREGQGERRKLTRFRVRQRRQQWRRWSLDVKWQRTKSRVYHFSSPQKTTIPIVTPKMKSSAWIFLRDYSLSKWNIDFDSASFEYWDYSWYDCRLHIHPSVPTRVQLSLRAIPLFPSIFVRSIPEKSRLRLLSLCSLDRHQHTQETKIHARIDEDP